MADIVGVGMSVYDMILIMDHFPEEDTKQGAQESRVQCGGPCAVAMVTASKLGVPAAFMGATGDDIYSDTIMDILASYGVDVSGMRHQPDSIGGRTMVILNTSKSTRTCIGMGGQGVRAAAEPSDINLEVLKNAKYLHLDGSQPAAAEFAAQKAKEYGVRISMDADLSAKRNPFLMQYVDELIPSERTACELAGTSDVHQAAQYLMDTYHPEVVIITQGPEGGFILAQDGTCERYPAFPVNAVDTNGAGDVFHGAYVAARIKGMNYKDAAVFASAASAIKCTRFTACEGAPHAEEVEAFLQERGIKIPV